MCNWFKKLCGGKKCCSHEENKSMETPVITPEPTPEMPTTNPEMVTPETNYGNQPKTE